MLKLIMENFVFFLKPFFCKFTFIFFLNNFFKFTKINYKSVKTKKKFKKKIFNKLNLTYYTQSKRQLNGTN